MRSGWLSFVVLCLCACSSATGLADTPTPSPPAQQTIATAASPIVIAPDFVVPLWPDGPPGPVPQGLTEQIVERTNPFGLTDRAAHNVTRPTLSVFRPERPNGGAILIVPGGGYAWVVIDKEGFEGAAHYVAQGYTVYVLAYRLPHQGWQAGRDAPLQDAQRAVRVIRARADMDKIKTDKVLVMGFSAGGHVAGTLASAWDKVVTTPVDATDQLSARPDLTVLVYPVVTMNLPLAHARSRENFVGKDPSADTIRRASLESNVHPNQMPTFLMHAVDDAAVPVGHALKLFEALRAASVPSALHIFERGGHGFGMRGIKGTPLEIWPSLVTDWAVAHGFLSPASSPARLGP